MKTILLIIVINLSNPSEQALFAHKAFATQAICEQAAVHITKTVPDPAHLRTLMYCVDAEDLTATN